MGQYQVPFYRRNSANLNSPTVFIPKRNDNNGEATRTHPLMHVEIMKNHKFNQLIFFYIILSHQTRNNPAGTAAIRGQTIPVGRRSCQSESIAQQSGLRARGKRYSYARHQERQPENCAENSGEYCVNTPPGAAFHEQVFELHFRHPLSIQIVASLRGEFLPN